MSDARRWVYYIADPLPDGLAEPRNLLGGKGASLNAMGRAGLPVPPGFVITSECCRWFHEHGHAWPDGLEDEVRCNLRRLEQDTGRTYGAGERPLLVSVRSGAATSMPGMMDTLLNVGLHPGLARDVGDTRALLGPLRAVHHRVRATVRPTLTRAPLLGWLTRPPPRRRVAR